MMIVWMIPDEVLINRVILSQAVISFPRKFRIRSSHHRSTSAPPASSSSFSVDSFPLTVQFGLIPHAIYRSVRHFEDTSVVRPSPTPVALLHLLLVPSTSCSLLCAPVFEFFAWVEVRVSIAALDEEKRRDKEWEDERWSDRVERNAGGQMLATTSITVCFVLPERKWTTQVNGVNLIGMCREYQPHERVK